MGSSASSKRTKKSARSGSVPAGSQTSTARWTTCESVTGAGSVGMSFAVPDREIVNQPRHSLHPLDRLFDLLEGRAGVDRAEPEHRSGLAARWSRAPPSPRRPSRRTRASRLPPSRVKQTIPRGRRDHLPPRSGSQHRLGVLRQRHPVRDRRAERVEPEHLHAQPELEGARASRELDPSVAEVDLASERVAQVLAAQGERALEQARLPHQHRARLVGLEEPLVRIDRRAIGPLDARQHGPPAGVSTAAAPYAPSTWNHSPSASHSAAARPEDRPRPCWSSPRSPRPRTASAPRPGRRRSPRRRRRPAAGSRSRSAAPEPTTPPSPRSRRIEACAWSLRYTTPPPPRDSRAATSAVSDAIEPPLVEQSLGPHGHPAPPAQPVEHRQLDHRRARTTRPMTSRAG